MAKEIVTNEIINKGGINLVPGDALLAVDLLSDDRVFLEVLHPSLPTLAGQRVLLGLQGLDGKYFVVKKETVQEGGEIVDGLRLLPIREALFNPWENSNDPRA